MRSCVKKIVLVFSVVLVIGTFILFKHFSSNKIEKVLKSESYNYLPSEAKKYIEDIYNETGEIILTEKNKEDNTPYLNPKYIEYLNLSDEEKNNIELLPDVYITDYEVNKSFSDSNLPSSYDLRNVDGKNFVSSIKNQGSTGICWAFASIENVETLLMKQKGQSYSDIVPKFSVRQMDYATSTDKLIKSYTDIGTISCTPVENCSYYAYKNSDNGSRNLGEGGNFFTSTIIMSNGLSLVDESVLPWNEDSHTYWPKDIFDYNNSKYELNSSISLGVINQDTASKEVIDSYVTEVKNYMLQYGGPFVGTYSPTSTCGFTNVDGTKAMKTDDCLNNTKNKNLGHALQIVGWDDNYEYSYCENGTQHDSVVGGTCKSGQLTSGKGAWILRNSWGEDTEEAKAYKYFYLTFDSTRLSIGFTTSISEMASRSWDNNYHSNPWIDSKISNGMAGVKEQTKEFNTHNDKNEKIEKIKFVNAKENSKFNISVVVGEKEYKNIETINTTKVGVYTIDLASKNIIINQEKFTVIFKGDDNSLFYNDSISVFTSNVDKEKSVITYSSDGYDSTKPLSNENPLYVDGDNYWFLNLKTYLKNIPSNADLVYRIKKDDGVIATERAIGDFRKTIINNIGEARFEGSYSISNSAFSTKEAYGKTYTFEIAYGDTIVNSFPIKFSGKGSTTSSTVKLYANNGTENYKDIVIKDNTSSDFTNNGINNNKNFYNDGYYIVSWNTKADGTGTSYKFGDKVLVYKDMTLYAQWSTEKITFKVQFKQSSSGSYGINGTMSDQIYKYDEKIILPINNYVYDGYVFKSWFVNQGNNFGSRYYEQEITSLPAINYASYPVFNNTIIKFYAEWLKEDNYYTISFEANGGIGEMKPINAEKYAYKDTLASNMLKKNTFTNDGYKFVSWNTNADGTGTTYSDKALVKSDTNITLYAQWEKVEEKITITYCYDENCSIKNEYEYNKGEKVNIENPTKDMEKYNFISWNTMVDGTGETYNVGDGIILENDVILYAQWEKIKVKITYCLEDSCTNKNEKEYEIGKTIKIENCTIEMAGYYFDSWNTKIDGTGQKYNVGDEITIENNLVLYPIFKSSVTYSINDYSVDDNSNIISKIVVGTTENNFKSHITLGNNYSVTVDSSNNLIYTGSKTKIYNSSNLIKEFTNVVTGDINGDAVINSADLLKIRQHLIGVKPLNGIYFTASDINYDNTVNSADLLRIRQHLIGTKTIG